MAVEPCPPIEPDDGTGRPVVTGAMQHLAANLLSVEVEGLPEPLGVTTTHPIWSEDRQDFIPAGGLTVGEQLPNLDGTPARIVRITPHRGPPVPVYNLEVDAQHVYRVGQTGLLVHNTCPTWPSNPKDMDDFLGVPGTPIPDGPTTPGRGKVVWRPNHQTEITFEQHPYHVGAPSWHTGPHWHLDTPQAPHQRFVPGDDISGY